MQDISPAGLSWPDELHCDGTVQQLSPWIQNVQDMTWSKPEKGWKITRRIKAKKRNKQSVQKDTFVIFVLWYWHSGVSLSRDLTPIMSTAWHWTVVHQHWHNMHVPWLLSPRPCPIMSSRRYGFSTPYRLTIRNSARLFNIVLFNMGVRF